MIMIGSARIDERGKASGGAPGDQKQTKKPDTIGEVSMQPFYVHSKGWYVLRAKDDIVGHTIAISMKRACNNKNIGYSQSDRYSLLNVEGGTKTKKKCNCDCSSLIRQCVKEATGNDIGECYTGNLADKLEKSGYFYQRIDYNKSTPIFNGDILITKVKGHTAAVVSGGRVRLKKNKEEE